MTMATKTNAITTSLLAASILFSAGTSSASAAVPAAPAGLTATASLQTHAALSWTASSDATRYNIYRGTTPGGEALIPTQALGNTFEDTGLGNGQAYYYRVTAVNADGESQPSGEVSVITKAPDATGFKSTAGDSQIVLTWNASPSATAYRIYRDTLGGVGGAADFLVTGTTYTDTGLINGTTYYYEIAAINASGGENLTYSGETTSAMPKAASEMEAPAGPPAHVTARAGNGRVLLTWLPANNATTYDVFRGTSGNTETLWHAGVVAIAFTDSGLANGVRYFYKVRAVNAGHVSPLSNEAAATPWVPSAPVNLTVKAGSGQLVLNWTSDGDSYAIYRGAASGSETLLDSGLTGNTFTDAGLTNGTPCYYKVQALNAGGSSPLSAEVSATPSGPAPRSWSGVIRFGLPGEPVQSCQACIPDINRPIQGALFSAFSWSDTSMLNLQALARKYNLIMFPPLSFNFGTSGNPIYLTTPEDTSHQVGVIDYRWPQSSAQRIQAALTSASKLFPAHPEIQNTGLVLYGFSAGVNNINLAAAPAYDLPTAAITPSPLAHRVLAEVHLSEIDEDRWCPLACMDTAPHLYLASGLTDIFSTLNIGLEDFPAVTHDADARGLATHQGAPLTVIDNAGFGHGENPDHPFISIWLDAVLSQRLPVTLPVSAPVDLPSWQDSSSWVGTYDLTTSTRAPWGKARRWWFNGPGVRLTHTLVSPKSDDTDPRPYTWLPGRNTARAWLDYANTGKMPAYPPAAPNPSPGR
jgi:fibronectin type 3 domain-containing protein